MQAITVGTCGGKANVARRKRKTQGNGENDGIRMTKLEGMTTDQITKVLTAFLRQSCFVLTSSLDIGVSSFLRSNASDIRASSYKTIVSRRVGPTLSIDNFAPVNSEMHLTYFLAAEGSCENLRAA